MAKRKARKARPGAGNDMLIRSAELIGWALGGIEREIMETRDRLDALTRQATQLRSRMRGGSAPKGRGPAAAASFDEPGVTGAAPAAKPARKRRQISAAARKRISEIQKKRWAEWRKKNADKKPAEKKSAEK
jgi:hypothetical protein